MKPFYTFILLAGLSLQAAAQSCGGTDPSGNPSKPGLYAEYYSGYFNDNPNFFNSTTPGLIRVDSTLNFSASNSWGNIVPPATGTVTNPENYSVRWTGNIYIATGGTYTFYLLSDDGSYMWFDDAALAASPTIASATINNGGLHSPATVSATIDLPAGMHPVTIFYGENTGLNQLTLEYSSAAITRRTVPGSILCSSAHLSPTPIKLLAFDASVLSSNEVKLQWSTATETNNNFFTVERSKDALEFEAVQKVAGAGISTVTKYYTINDQAPLPGTSYYRLKQTDYNGTSTYSQIASVSIESFRTGITIFPNPSSGTLNLEILSRKAEEEKGHALKIVDFSGKTIYSATIDPAVFREQLILERGCYMLLFTETDGSVITRKIIVN